MREQRQYLGGSVDRPCHSSAEHWVSAGIPQSHITLSTGTVGPGDSMFKMQAGWKLGTSRNVYDGFLELIKR